MTFTPHDRAAGITPFFLFLAPSKQFFLTVVYSVAVGGRQKLCMKDSSEQLKLHFIRSAIWAEGIWNVHFFTPSSPPPFSVWLYFWTTCSDWDYFISSDRQCGFQAQDSLISWNKIVEYIFFQHQKLWIIHDYLRDSNCKADTRCSSSNQQLLLELSDCHRTLSMVSGYINQTKPHFLNLVVQLTVFAIMFFPFS